MLESNSPVWDKIVASYRAMLKTVEEVNRMELHFPQFLSHTFSGNEFHIGVKENLQKDWFTQLYAQDLEKAIENAELGTNVKVVFDVVQSDVQVFSSVARPTIEKDVSKPILPGKKMRILPSTLPLQENYTFENFVCGPSNSYAYATATAVAKGLGRTTYNPLFIWGGTGLGKTHLMEAIGHYVMAKKPDSSVCYITAEKFLNEFVNALASSSLSAFRARYRKYDLLLIDDVQFIVGKKNFQEEFFNTICEMLLYNKQVVMTSDVAPKELKLEDRLISRFQQGMVVEIELPSYETRLAIIKSKIKMQSNPHVIDDSILDYIAENIRSHVRAIEGALSRVIAFMDINPDMTLNLEIVKHLLKDVVESETTIKNITPESVIAATAEHYGVSIKDIKGPGRPQAVVLPRQIAMFIACKLTTSSLKSIGDAFERTHTTVYYGSQQMQKRLTVEPELKSEISAILAKLGQKDADIFE